MYIKQSDAKRMFTRVEPIYYCLHSVVFKELVSLEGKELDRTPVVTEPRIVVVVVNRTIC